MPQITITETLEVDGGAVTITRYMGGNSSTDMHLAIDDGNETVSVMLSAEDVRALAERMLDATPKKPVTRSNTTEGTQK